MTYRGIKRWTLRVVCAIFKIVIITIIDNNQEKGET